MAGRARNAAKNAEAILLAMDQTEERSAESPAFAQGAICSQTHEWIKIADKTNELVDFAERMAEVFPNLTQCLNRMKSTADEVGEQGGVLAYATASEAASGLTVAEIEEDYLFRILDGLGDLETVIDAMKPREASGEAPAEWGTKKCPFQLSCQAVDEEVRRMNDFIAERIDASVVLTHMLCEAKGELANHESMNRYYNMALAEVRGISYESMRSE